MVNISNAAKGSSNKSIRGSEIRAIAITNFFFDLQIEILPLHL